MTIQKMYELKCSTPSDINEHLPILKRYSDTCEVVTEMGTRNCVSIYAFLASKAKTVVAYDIERQPEVDEVFEIVSKENKDFQFIEADVLKVEIEETDMLTIDTFHTYSQLKAELAKHAGMVRKYIAFHDTTSFGLVGEQPYLKQGHSGMNDGKGLLAAINEFLFEHPEWELEYKVNNCNGLTIIKRK